MLKVNDWILINSITLKIHEVDDFNKMRTEMFQILASMIDFDAATFYIIQCFGTYELSNPIGYNCTLEEMMTYVNTYKDIDYSKNLVYTGKNIAYRESSILSDEERRNTEYYKNVYLANNFHYSLHINLSYQGSFLGIVSIFRTLGKPDFSDDDLLIFDTIKDHMAFRIYRDLKNREGIKCSFDECIKNNNLTAKESEVLKLILFGKSNEEMCDDFCISYNTLKKHILNIYKKTGYNSRVILMKEIKKP